MSLRTRRGGSLGVFRGARVRVGQCDLAVPEDPTLLIQDPTKELRSFEIALTTPMGSKRGRGRGSLIDSVLEAVDGFYAEVLQNLKSWSAAPPKLRAEADALAGEQEDVAPALVSTALSSQDDGAVVRPVVAQERSADSDPDADGEAAPAGLAEA